MSSHQYLEELFFTGPDKPITMCIWAVFTISPHHNSLAGVLQKTSHIVDNTRDCCLFLNFPHTVYHIDTINIPWYTNCVFLFTIVNMLNAHEIRYHLLYLANFTFTIKVTQPNILKCTQTQKGLTFNNVNELRGM